MIKKLLLLSIFSVSLFAMSGQELFESKCTSCHGLKPPTTKDERMAIVAPPIGNILYHLNHDFKSPEEIKKHIVEFTLNPTKEKAICPSVRRFGVMPSQKENVTESEINLIAEFLTNIIIYSNNSHKGGNKGCSGGACSSKQNGNGGGCSSKHQH